MGFSLNDILNTVGLGDSDKKSGSSNPAMSTTEFQSTKAGLQAQLELATIQKQIREQDEWRPAGQSADDVDIFQTLKKTNETLTSVLSQQNQGSTYVQQMPSAEAKGPNYLMYGGIALVAFLVLWSGKIKLKF